MAAVDAILNLRTKKVGSYQTNLKKLPLSMFLEYSFPGYDLSMLHSKFHEKQFSTI